MKYIITILVLSFKLLALTPDDIKAMNDFGILISFSDTEKPKKIPKNLSVKKFLNVTYLSFNNANIYNLPNWLSKLTELRGLDLSNAKIDLDELEKITTLKSLTVLKLANNEKLLKDINNSNRLLSLLSNFDLNELDLSNTGGKLCSYSHLDKVKNLVELFLSNNNLNKSSNCSFQTIGLNKLRKLEVLDLSNNNINGDLATKYLPVESLIELNLAKNNIQNFKYYKPFPKLEMLNLSKNSSIKIENNFGGLLALKKLVTLKRESNINLPNGLKKRLSITKKLETKKEDIKDKSILKKLGILKTHVSFDDKTENDIAISNIPIGSILYLKKDLLLPKGDYKMRLNKSCVLWFNSDKKNARLIRKGNFFEIKKYKDDYNDDDIYFSEKSLVNNIKCGYSSSRSLYLNDYFLLFLKKPKEYRRTPKIQF